MCLITALFRIHPDAPLIFGANRDEWLSREATPFGVLHAHSPRILGGRDQVAKGTWLAVNEYGVVAGLTNKPMLGGADKSKRSRGELPLLCAAHPTAAAAAQALTEVFSPSDFNPCWLLVGDAHHLFYIDMTQGEHPDTQELPPGITVLENRPVDADSAKADWVRASLDAATDWHAEELVGGITQVLASHTIPEAVHTAPEQRSESWRPAETEAPCVHAGSYGTRCASIILVRPGDRPQVWHAEGPPCKTRMARQNLWAAVPPMP